MASVRALQRMLPLACLVVAGMGVSWARAPEDCATVSVVANTVVTAGYNVGIHGSVNNCSERKQRYTLVVSSLSDCGVKEEIASFRLAFRPGENRMFGVSYATTAETCPGLATVNVEVVGGDAVLATASTTFTVVN